MFGGNKTYSSHMIKLWNDSNIQTWMGLASLAEANDYNLDEINTITEEIRDLDILLQKESIALVPCLRKIL